MEDFLNIQTDWFGKKYMPLLGRRFWTFKIALNLFLQRNNQVIIETGCQRLVDDWGAGCSTTILGEFAHRYKKMFISVDNKEDNLNKAKEITREYAEDIEYKLSDSIQYLENFPSIIDFLYLDSYDCAPENEEITLQAQNHQLKEIKAAYDKLSMTAIVLLDDNYYPNGGKTKLAKQFLKDHRWVNIMDYEQSLWVPA